MCVEDGVALGGEGDVGVGVVCDDVGAGVVGDGVCVGEGDVGVGDVSVKTEVVGDDVGAGVVGSGVVGSEFLCAARVSATVSIANVSFGIESKCCRCDCVYFLNSLVESPVNIPVHKTETKRIKDMTSVTECLLVVDRLLSGSSMVFVGDSKSILIGGLNIRTKR